MSSISFNDRILATMRSAPYNWTKYGDAVRLTPIVKNRYRVTIKRQMVEKGDMAGIRNWVISDSKYFEAMEVGGKIVLTDLTGDKWVKQEVVTPKVELEPVLVKTATKTRKKVLVSAE